MDPVALLVVAVLTVIMFYFAASLGAYFLSRRWFDWLPSLAIAMAWFPSWCLLAFPAANRDPAVFDRPNDVILDREVNRHVAFGSGIHRCAGSNIARMELRVAVQVWLERFPVFSLADADAVTWAGGQVRGPRSVPVKIG